MFILKYQTLNVIAQKWWVANNALWKNVRDKWETLFDRHKDLTLEES